MSGSTEEDLSSARGANPLFIQHVSEADIDWIVCTELNSNPRFRDWLGETIFGLAPLVHEGAWRSVCDPILGESDVVWAFRAADGRSRMVLIENKIHAGAQPCQSERYAERAQLYVQSNYCSEFKTVLLSPNGYTSTDSDKYERHLSYENVQRWFESEDGERSKYFAALFRAAIEKRIHTGPQVIDAEVTEFRKSYFAYFREFFQDRPDVTMQPPKDSWKGEVWFHIRSTRLPHGAYVSHKSPMGFVDLTFPNTDAHRLKTAESMLDDGMTIQQTSKSAAIRLSVPEIRQFSDFQLERCNVGQAFTAVRKLLDFYDRQRSQLEPLLSNPNTEASVTADVAR